MKRILCILSGMNMGGAETFLMKLYRNLNREKFQMDFCINNAERQVYEDEIEALGGRIHRISCKSKGCKAFREALFKVVHDNGYKSVLRVTSNAMGFLDLKVAHDAGAKICAARSSSAGGDLTIFSKLAHLFGGLLYGRYVNRKIAPSDLTAIHTFGRPAYKKGAVIVLKNALDLDTLRFDANLRVQIRSEFGLNLNHKLIGEVGRFSAEKNHEFLIEVFSRLYADDQSCRLMLTGDGALEDGLRTKVAKLGLNEAVIFTGIRRDIPAILSALDVFVMPSLYEGMPNAAIEAQATGMPCVLSDAITRDANITGLIKYLSINDVDIWVKAIKDSFAIPRHDTREDFVRNGYEISTVTRQFERIMTEGV